MIFKIAPNNAMTKAFSTPKLAIQLSIKQIQLVVEKINQLCI